MKSLLFAALLALATQAHASTASANQGHHGGANSGALGCSCGASHGTAAAGQSGNGGRYSMVDQYQPWPESEMRNFEKSKFVPYSGE
jgi:hypothetical protein